MLSKQIRFAAGFGLFPELLSNSFADNYEMLRIFCGAQQGNRTMLAGESKFELLNPLEFPPRKEKVLRTKYCSLSGLSEILLTQFDLKRYRDKFNEWDRDGTGSIDKEEVLLVMTSLGQRPAKGEIDGIMAKMDKDGSGAVSFEEFLVGMIDVAEMNRRSHETSLLFPEFALAVAMCAKIAFSKESHAKEEVQNKPENRMKKLFRKM